MKIVSSLLVGFTILITTQAKAHALPQMFDVKTRQAVEFKKFIADVKDADAIFVGETHDEKTQHQNELDIVRSVKETGASVAIALEMFSTDYQQQLDDWTDGKLSEDEFRKIYSKNWSYDWHLYRDIFIFARDNRVPIIALNVPKPLMAKVVRQGSAALTEEEKKTLPPKISWDLNPQQKEYLRRITAQVFGNRPVPIRLNNFQEAQALRNSVMAWRIWKFREKAPKSRVVALAGTWHAIKNGAPEQLQQYGKVNSKTVLPELPELAVKSVTPDEADYLILK